MRESIADEDAEMLWVWTVDVDMCNPGCQGLAK